MSTFYRILSEETARDFKRRKKAFKRGKPCAMCGKIYPPEEMMVAHKKPVSELSDHEALYDVSNWEVRCIKCEQSYNRTADRAKNLLTNKNEYNKEQGEDK